MAEYKKFDFKKLYFILYIILVLLFVYSLFKLGIFLLPFVVGLFISILIQPLSNFLQKKIRLSQKLSTIISVVVFILIFIGIIGLSSLKLIQEIYNLSKNLDSYSVLAQKIWNEGIDKLNSYLNLLPDGLTVEIDRSIKNIITIATKNLGKVINNLFSIITSIPTMILYVCITILSTFFMSLDKTNILNFLEQQFPEIWLEKLYAIKREMFNVLGSYLKAQLILMTICFIELLISLNILAFFKLEVHYPLLMSLFICIVDALPILGAGTILLPWVVISIILGNYKLALGLLIIYLLVLSVRQMLEPKLISENIGVHPLITLISMYSGFKILGVIGFLVGPVVMIILKNVFSRELEVGFFKEIFGNPKNTEDDNITTI